MRPCSFEVGLWSRGKQHNGRYAHCWSTLYLKLNDQSTVFLINNKTKWWRILPCWRMMAKNQIHLDWKGPKDYGRISVLWKARLAHLKPTGNEVDLISSPLQWTITSQNKCSLRMRSDAEWSSTIKAPLIGVKIRPLAVSSQHLHTMPQQDCDWCTCCSWTFTVSVKSFKTQVWPYVFSQWKLAPSGVTQCYSIQSCAKS